MYFLKKCAEKGCKRYGVIALTPNAKFCNAHAEIEVSTVVGNKPINIDERDENGARVGDENNQSDE